MNFDICGAQGPDDGQHDHRCIGDAGHPSLHWCLLGHCWPRDDEEASDQ